MLLIPLKLITTLYAISVSVLCTLVYVTVLYLHPNGRPSGVMTKDHPSVIKTRITLVSIASALCAALVVTIGKAENVHWTSATFKILGLHFPLSGVLYSVSTTMVLFAGPLFEHLIADGGLLTIPQDIVHSLTSWTGVRNYIAGPVTEELVFRACIIPLHFFAAVPIGQIIFYTPLYFGLAHIHHIYERYRTRPGQVMEACVVSLVQFGYTTIFGWLASYLFIKTGSIWSCVLVHSLCNSLGLPRVTGRVSGSLMYSVVYYTLLIAGSLAAAKMVAMEHVSPSAAYQPYSFV